MLLENLMIHPMLVYNVQRDYLYVVFALTHLILVVLLPVHLQHSPGNDAFHQ